MEKTDVLIIGAGLAGLSTAYYLKRPYEIVEAEDVPGGNCRSVKSNGSIYDFTGHLLHLHRPEIKALVSELMPGQFMEVERKAGIYINDRFLPFPFQANFHPLPKPMVKDCLLGFVKAWSAGKRSEVPINFNDWALSTFGEGICRYFLFPYNEKLYRTDLEEMSTDWVSWSIPQPDLETVIDGALGTVHEGLGYNARFLYPRQGGIEILPDSLSRKVKPIICNRQIVKIDPEKQMAVTDSGEEFIYESLVSTIPLNQLLEILVMHDEPKVKEWAGKLRWVKVYNLNLTLDRPPEWDWHWLYLPEPRFRCYRVGVTSNFSPALAPEGCCTIYTEVSLKPEENPDEAELRKEILNDLKVVGLLEKGVNIKDETVIRIDPAYVVHDHFRMAYLSDIQGFLEKNGIISTGRWGAWEYGGMEDALWQGFETALRLNP